MKTGGLSLETLAAGAAQELFEDELAEVIANICGDGHINFDPKFKRKLTLEFTFAPNERDPSNCQVDIKVSKRLAPRLTFKTDLLLGIDQVSKRATIGHASKNRRIEELIERKKKVDAELRAEAGVSDVEILNDGDKE